MSLRQLVEGDCGGVNPLMQLGSQLARDAAHKDEGFVKAQFERSMRQDEHMVNEFLGQVAGPPQSFHMDTLLEEMREMDHARSATLKLEESVANQWNKDFKARIKLEAANGPQIINMQARQQNTSQVHEFFDDCPNTPLSILNRPPTHLAICPQHPSAILDQQPPTGLTKQFFDEVRQEEDWVDDYQTNNKNNEQAAANYNEQFWQRLQDEWTKMSEDQVYPWLSEDDESCNPYKEYKFAEENPMQDIGNALEKGKEYLSKGDIPSAVLCFEAAVSKDAENVEAWELLGISQAENEMDPHAIAALIKSLDLKPNNLKLLMALAVCYTNEGLHPQAIKMLNNWLQVHPKYKHITISQSENTTNEEVNMTSSFIPNKKVHETINMFLQAVRMDTKTIDPEVQEALGVLFNISGEYDKAADCFEAALQVDESNAKVWNRLGASLANGSRSVDAIKAYRNALELEPGFIRVRYNVGVCCLNLKVYKEAAEHFLTALNMQADVAVSREMPALAAGHGQKQMSESIWSTLKMVISLMGRNDLQSFVSERNLAALNAALID